MLVNMVNLVTPHDTAGLVTLVILVNVVNLVHMVTPLGWWGGQCEDRVTD